MNLAAPRTVGVRGVRAARSMFSTTLSRFVVACASLVGSAFPGLAAPAPWNPDTPAARARFDVPPAQEVPAIDGRLKDAVWKSAMRVDTFARMAGDAPVVERTEAWIASDGKFLYVAFRCHDSQPDRVRASETQRGSNGVYGDDHITVFVDSQDQRRGYSSFSVNPLGTQTESLEGGTAGNITWSGDWKAAATRDAAGWSCEVAIPYGIMRHPPKAKGFGLLLLRGLNREGNPMVWPALPPEGQSWSGMSLFLPRMELRQPMPDQRARAVVLPYHFATAEPDGLAGRTGLDVKLPVTTTLTSLLALRPDFRNVEQDVANVNFSYNEQFVPDRRPFFAEGAEFLPDSELFYTRRVSNFDAGLKVVGREGPTSLGLVTSRYRSGPADRDATALSIRHNLGLLDSVSFNAVMDTPIGSPMNQVVRAGASKGWIDGDRRHSVYGHHTQSWLGGDAKGIDSEFGWFSRATNGKLRYSVARDWMSGDFTSNLGLLVNPDRVDWRARVGIGNQFDRGPIQGYDAEVRLEDADRYSTGEFFYDSVAVNGGLQLRNGWGIGTDLSRGRRRENATTLYRDQFAGGGIGWNQRSLFQAGGIRTGSGRVAGLPVRTLGISQGFLISSRINVSANVNQQWRGTRRLHQAIVTGTWRIDTLQSVSIRLISQNGTGNAANVGAQVGTNLYAAYAFRSRGGGADYYVILGDPNSGSTRSQLTVKVTRPF
ncbi:MAG: DUF5916 domain-containing protein [Armatimonadota bacterium]